MCRSAFTRPWFSLSVNITFLYFKTIVTFISIIEMTTVEIRGETTRGKRLGGDKSCYRPGSYFCVLFLFI